MSELVNIFEGGTDAVAITELNSGGVSGDAIDAKNVTGSLVYDTDVAITNSVSALATVATGENAYVVWNSTSWVGASEIWAREAFQVSDATPVSNFTIMNFRKANGSTIGAEVQLTSAGKIRLRADSVEEYISTYTVTNDTPVRIEVHVVSSATVGDIDIRLFYGNNLNGVTPDESFGGTKGDLNTGDGTVGGIAYGVCSNTGQTLSMWFDNLGISDVGWLGPTVIAEPYIGAPATSVFGVNDTPVTPDPPSNILVPATGAWFGVTAPAKGGDGHTSTTGLAQWVAEVGVRPHIIGWYKTYNWSGIPTAAELAMADPGGGEKHAIPFYHWKVGSATVKAGTWEDVANGVYDAEIDDAAAGIKTYPYPVFLSFFHEPEDNENAGSNSAANHIAMWRRCRDRFDAAGVTNCVYVLQYGGYGTWADDALGTGFLNLYPGDDYVDWVAWDPYTGVAWKDEPDELLNAKEGGESYTPPWQGFYDFAVANFPDKPLMLAEFGFGRDAAHMTDAQAAATLDTWASLGLASHPNMKAFVYWNAVGTRDYQINDEPLFSAAMANLLTIPWFDQDPDQALSL